MKSEVKRFQEYAKKFYDWYWSDKNKHKPKQR